MDTVASKTGKRILAGSLIIIAGILMLLSNIGYFHFDLEHIFFSWPTILIVAGVIVMLGSNFRSGFFITAIGILFLISRYYFLDFWTLWPAILIIIGINALLGARRSPEDYKWHRRHKEWKEYHGNWVEAEKDWKDAHKDWEEHKHWKDTRDWKQEEIDADTIHESNVLSGSKKYIHSSNFKGGKINAVFGGAEIDLSDCKLAPGNNILDIETVFGGITLFVPNDWKVIIDVSPVFGDFSDERRISSVQNFAEDRALVIRGSVVFGGGKIKSA